MEKKDNLILIGMPASGKSTVGVILAKVIGYDFIDSDLLIQRREGMRLSEIIAGKGIDGFLEVENSVNASIEASRSVIATGGSAVYGEEAMRHLRDLGAVIYLQVDYETIRKRLHNTVIGDSNSRMPPIMCTLDNIFHLRHTIHITHLGVTVKLHSLHL